MATLTGQELVTLALDRLADGSPVELVRRLRLREVSDAEDVAAQVRRWRKGQHEPGFAVTLRLLEPVGKVTPPRCPR